MAWRLRRRHVATSGARTLVLEKSMLVSEPVQLQGGDDGGKGERGGGGGDSVKDGSHHD